jgi:hypothetical protein
MTWYLGSHKLPLLQPECLHVAQLTVQVVSGLQRLVPLPVNETLHK